MIKFLSCSRDKTCSLPPRPHLWWMVRTRSSEIGEFDRSIMGCFASSETGAFLMPPLTRKIPSTTMGLREDKLLPFNKTFPDCRRFTTPGKDPSCTHCTTVFSAFRRLSTLKWTQRGSHSNALSDLECLNPLTARRIRATNRLNLCQSKKHERILDTTLHVSCFTTTEQTTWHMVCWVGMGGHVIPLGACGLFINDSNHVGNGNIESCPLILNVTQERCTIRPKSTHFQKKSKLSPQLCINFRSNHSSCEFLPWNGNRFQRSYVRRHENKSTMDATIYIH